MERTNMLTLDDILQDIYALEDEMRTYERKFGVLSETFFESYTSGEEPPNEAWVKDWTAWASAYQLRLRRRKQYESAITTLRGERSSLAAMIERTARHESIPVPA